MQRKTVRKWLHRFTNTNTVNSIKNSGRPRNTTQEEDAILVQHIQNNPFVSIVRASNETGMQRKTASRRVREAGLKCYRAAKRVKLTDEHRERRVLFCQNMLQEKEDGLVDFNDIIFTDEKTFCTDVIHCKNVFRPPNNRYEPKYVSTTNLSGRLAGGYWGWICSGGPGELVQIGGRFNSTQYLGILQDDGLPTMDLMFGDRQQIIYMHDNSRVHSARMIQEYLSTVGFNRVLNWPANSPDLNPIERVWATITRDWPNVQGPRNANVLNELVMARWNELRHNYQYFRNLYDGLEGRFKYVIEHNGHFNP